MPPRRRPTQPGPLAAALAENVTGIVVPPSGVLIGRPAPELLSPQVRRSARPRSGTPPDSAPPPRKQKGKAPALDAPAVPPVPFGYGMSGVGPSTPSFPPPVALERLAAHPNMDTVIDFDIYAWVRWDESPSQRIFPVRIRSTETIFTVQLLVFQLKQNGALRGIRPSDLILWKPKDPIPFKDADARVNSLPYNLADAAEDLPVDHLVGDYFSEFTPHLHIIVEPVSGERRIFIDFWYTLWHHDRDVSPQIPFFERCTVQRDGSRPDIPLPTKCWTLQLPRGVAHQLPFNIMTLLVRDDYMEALKELFLSAGWADPQLPETLDSVDEFENPFLNTQKMLGGTDAFVLTGNPGIGKSIWLLIVLVLRLNARLPTIYQHKPNTIFFFHRNGILKTTNLDFLESLMPDGVWALVDSNRELTNVDSSYTWSNIFVVQTPSPRPDRLEWAKKVQCNMFFLQPWSQSELLCARNFQKDILPESELADFIVKYGPSARLAYSYSHRPDVYESELEDALAEVPREQLKYLIGDANVLNLRHEVSHRIYVVHPAVPRRRAIFKLPSKHICNLLVKYWTAKTAQDATSLYSLFVQRPITRSCAGLLLERLVNDDLHKGGVRELTVMKKDVGSKNVLWNIPNVDGAKAELRISAAGFSIADHSAVATHSSTSSTSSIAFHLFSGDTILSESGYYQPTSGSQVTFDAFLYDAKDKHAALIQATVSEKHEVKKKGFEQLKAKGVQTFSYIAVTPPKEKLQIWFPRTEETWPVTRGWYQLEWMV